MVNKGNHPQMAARFRLVKYYNLPIYIYIYIYIFTCYLHDKRCLVDEYMLQPKEGVDIGDFAYLGC